MRRNEERKTSIASNIVTIEFVILNDFKSKSLGHYSFEFNAQHYDVMWFFPGVHKFTYSGVRSRFAIKLLEFPA